VARSGCALTGACAHRRAAAQPPRAPGRGKRSTDAMQLGLARSAGGPGAQVHFTTHFHYVQATVVAAVMAPLLASFE